MMALVRLSIAVLIAGIEERHYQPGEYLETENLTDEGFGER